MTQPDLDFFTPAPPPPPPTTPPVLQALIEASESFANDPPDQPEPADLCTVCGESICPGDIVQSHDDGLAHSHCIDGLTEPPNHTNPPKDAKPTTNARKLVAQVIEAEQDFEFYPTTQEIIAALCRDINLVATKADTHRRPYFSSLLDIGAGNGKVLEAVRDFFSNEDRRWAVSFSSLHAIEKSTILCQQLHEDILIVGTEFEEQSLLSKSVDVIFSNPPYSQFERWAEKIIRESASRVIYLVIPIRWEQSQRIQDALRYRNAEVKKVGQYDFTAAEDRQARATVNLLRIELKYDEGADAFERFFNEQFSDLIGKFKGPPREDPEEEKEQTNDERKGKFSQLVVGESYPEALVSLYNQEMAHVEKNYALAGQLDADLLRELGISPAKICACLRERLKGMKNLYWNELFSRLKTITDRLTTESRKRLLDVLHRHVQVDFTVSNICAVLIWVIKNANRYIDSQLIDVYEIMVDKCNVHLYKSNQRTWRDEQWRYCHRDDLDKPSHYSLDYRIVTHRVGGWRAAYSWERGLEESGRNFLCDLLTIAKNLGFDCSTVDHKLIQGGENWEAGQAKAFYFKRKDGRREILYDVRAFKNRNMHLRLNKEFILALNVEHGRLKGWLRSGEEAAQELSEPKAAKYFKINTQLTSGNPALLLT